MNIACGLMPGQVLQRNRDNTATALVRGNTAASGAVECRICKANGRTLRGFDWQPVGMADGQTFVASLAKMPTGGPYAVSLRIRAGGEILAETTVGDVFVGDVWLLGGQSNMQGVGKLAEGPRPHPLVRAFTMRDDWAMAKEPLHFLPEATHYTERLKNLVAALRRDMGQPRLPWLMAQLGRHVQLFSAAWNSIQEQQRLLPEVIAALAVVPTVDLEIDDPIHLSSRGQAALGKRFARVAERLVHGNRGYKPAIACTGCQVTPIDTLNSSMIRLKYRHAVGGLRSAGRPHGFTLHDASGAVIERGVCNATLAKDTVILTVWLPLRALLGCSISYGYGMNPYCNITDGDGMGLPAMLRQPLAVPEVLPFALHWPSSRVNRRSWGG